MMHRGKSKRKDQERRNSLSPEKQPRPLSHGGLAAGFPAQRKLAKIVQKVSSQAIL